MADTFRNRSGAYAHYFSEHYSVHNAALIDDPTTMARTIRIQFGPHLPTDRSARILDAGAGVGLMVRGMQELGYRNVEGVDISAEQVRQARAMGIPVVEDDALAYMAGRPGSFDLISAIDLVEHLTRDECVAFLSAAREALRPGGRIVVRTINANGIFAGRSRWRDVTHETSFTSESLHMSFHLAGLRTVDIYGRDGHGPGAYGLAHRVVRGAYRAFWRGCAIAEWGIAEGRSFPLDLNIIGVASRP